MLPPLIELFAKLIPPIMLAVVAPLPLIGAPAGISPQTLEDDLAVNREEVAVPDHGSAVIPTKGGDRQRLRVEISHAPVSALANMEYQGCSAVSQFQA